MAVTLFSFHGRTGAGINYTGSGILCFYLFRDEKFLQRKIRGSRFLRFMGYSFRQGWPAHRLHTCLCSCKNTAEVLYPVCKPCYDSADYKGFKQFSAMNPVRTIWGWARFIRYAANPVFITSTGSFNSPMPGMCRMRAVYTKSGVMNKDTIFTVSSRYRIPGNTGIIYQLTCPESWSRDRLQELYFMFSPGTVSDITLNIFLILVKKEKNITIYPAATSSGYPPSKQLVKKRSVKFR